MAAAPPPVTAACTPSSDACTEPTTPSSLPFMPMLTLSKAGRFASRALASFVAASASAAPCSLTITRAGVHSSSALSLASQLALHSADISGGLTSPEHLGASSSTLQPPEHEPEQSALPCILQSAEQVPLQSAEQVPSPLPLQVPSQRPAQLPLLSLPSQVPSQVPSHLPLKLPLHSPLQLPVQLPLHSAPASTVQVPWHSPLHLPLTSPPSHSTLASPGLTSAEHSAAQLAM